MPELADRAVALAGELGAALPERPGVTGIVDLAVTGTDTGDVHVTLAWLDGRLTSVTPGAPATAELTLGLPAGDARSVVEGALAPSVAYMRGRLRTAGDNRLLLGILAATASPVFAHWAAGIRDALPAADHPGADAAT